ncbi:MAG: YHS domain-containing protein [Acidobacteriota bacterium]
MTTTPATISTETDPVCGMKIDPSQAASTSEYAGKTSHFCSAGCKAKFDENPWQFPSP